MKKFGMFMVVCAAMIFASCKDNNDNNEPETPSDPSGEVELMTPTESKKYIEETASEFMDKFRAADQKELMALARFVGEEYGELEFPENFEIEEEKFGNVPNYIRKMAKALAAGDASRAGAAAIEYTYTLDFTKFTGIYEPGVYEWVKTGNSSDVVFRFKDENGAPCELKAAMAGGNSEGSFVSDTWVDWDYVNGGRVEYDAQDVVKFKIPKEVTVTLTKAGTNICEAKVNSNIDVKGHNFNVLTNVRAMNITAAAKFDGNDNKVEMSASFGVSGQTLVTSTATLNGSKLCDIDHYIAMDGDEDDMLAMLHNGTAAVSVLNKIRIDADLTYNRDIYLANEGDWSSWDYNSKTEAEDAVKKAVESLNKYISAKVRFKNAVTQQASLIWKYQFDSWGSNSWEYYVEPLMKFDADGSTYGFEEYFENGFAGVQDQFESLIKSYKKVWESVR